MANIDYSRYLSERAQRRKPSAIRDLQRLQWLPGMISFGGGLPNPESFPITKIETTLITGETFTADLSLALQYGPSQGLTKFLAHLRTLQEKIHNVTKESDICVGNGGQDVLTKCFDLLLSPGDAIAVENPGYVGALAYLKTMDIKIIPLKTDSNGIDADDFANVLKEHKIKAVYTCPNGGNPTGINTSEDRKKAIISLSQEHDFIILEDDPYYFIQFVPKAQSYLKLCPERTIRFDSFSKIMSSGMRVGFATGPRPLLEKLILDYQVSSLHASNLSQTIISEILEVWSFEKFLEHTDNVQQMYRKRRDAFCQALKEVIPYLTFEMPEAGMFVWVNLPVADSAGLKEYMEKFKVIFVPGGAFTVDGNSSHVRLSYSNFKDDELYEGLGRFKKAIEAYKKSHN